MNCKVEEFIQERVSQELTKALNFNMLYGSALHKSVLGGGKVSEELYAFWEHGDPDYHKKLKILTEIGT